MHSKHFMNKYLMDLLPYKTVSQEIWSINPHCWSEVLKLDWNEATIEPAPEVRKAVSDFVSSIDFFHLYPSTHNKYLIKLLSQYTGVPEKNVQYFGRRMIIFAPRQKQTEQILCFRIWEKILSLILKNLKKI